MHTGGAYTRSRGDGPGLVRSFRRAACVAAIALPAAAAGQVQLTNWTDEAGVGVMHGPLPSTYPLGMGWMTGGVGVGDFDRDGLADLFVVGGGLTPDHLFINRGDGTFDHASSDWGLDTVHCGNGVAVGDANGDGWLDVYVTSFGPPPGGAVPGNNRLYLNEAGAGFANAAAALGVDTTCVSTTSAFGASFGDYDLDGRLDLFVTAWNAAGEGNLLFRQDPSGIFADVTDTAIGPTVFSGVRGFQSAFVDMNGDRWPELLVSADFETSRYLRNDGDGTFTDLTGPSGTGLDDNGMGQTVGDLDGDGVLDWYVTSIYMDDPNPWHHNGNMLYRGLGNHQFEEVSVASGVNDGGWGWGTMALDLDQDGRLDLVEVNGREAAGGEWTAEPAKLFYNQGESSFEEIGAAAGLDHAASGRCVSFLDLENDGDLDFVISTNDGRLELYRNDTAKAGHWLQVRLDTSAHPRLAPDGFGASVTAVTAAQTQVRVMNGSPSYLGTSQLVAHFGLAAATSVDVLRVDWPRGQVTVVEGVAADQRLVLQAPVPPDVDADGDVDVDDLLGVILAWGPCPAICAEDVDADGVIGVDDLVEVILGWTG